MGSMTGILHRSLYVAAAVAVASVSTNLPNQITNRKSIDLSSDPALRSQFHDLSPISKSSWVSRISISTFENFSIVTRIRVPLPIFNRNRLPNCISDLWGNNAVTSSPILISLYQSAELAKALNPKTCSNTSKTAPSEDLYRWHLPEPAVVDGNSDCSSAKSRTVVVLLGWLGAKQKHLNKYAEWYTSRGFHAITFTFPMSEVLSYQVGEKAEQDVELLVNNLAYWLEEEHGKNLVFHTFSNTGWLTYGVVLEKFRKHDPQLVGRIKGCIVDSAPAAAPDPKVWASGFSAAFLKKQSVATKGSATINDSAEDDFAAEEPKPAMTETALLAILVKFFQVVLKLPPVNRRLSDVIGVLSSGQPSCPQLYIYSSADRVIPARSVESFIELQRRSGHEVRSCDFVSTPHVDHFRSHPQLYTSQLTHFLHHCMSA